MSTCHSCFDKSIRPLDEFCDGSAEVFSSSVKAACTREPGGETPKERKDVDDEGSWLGCHGDLGNAFMGDLEERVASGGFDGVTVRNTNDGSSDGGLDVLEDALVVVDDLEEEASAFCLDHRMELCDGCGCAQNLSGQCVPLSASPF